MGDGRTFCCRDCIHAVTWLVFLLLQRTAAATPQPAASRQPGTSFVPSRLSPDIATVAPAPSPGLTTRAATALHRLPPTERVKATALVHQVRLAVNGPPRAALTALLKRTAARARSTDLLAELTPLRLTVRSRDLSSALMLVQGPANPSSAGYGGSSGGSGGPYTGGAGGGGSGGGGGGPYGASANGQSGGYGGGYSAGGGSYGGAPDGGYHGDRGMSDGYR